MRRNNIQNNANFFSRDKILIALTIGGLSLIFILPFLFYYSSEEETAQSNLDKIALAVKKNNLEFCNKIENTVFRDNCFLSLSHSNLNPAACDKINSADYKKYCLRYSNETGFSVNLSRTVWLNSIVQTNDHFNTANIVKFTYSFIPKNYSTSTLTVFLDENIIFERTKTLSLAESIEEDSGVIYLDKNYFNGSHLLSVRLVPLTSEKSSVTFSNLSFGFADYSISHNLYNNYSKSSVSIYPINLRELNITSNGYEKDTLSTFEGEEQGGIRFAWISAPIYLDTLVNLLNFKAEFKDKKGILGVYFDDNLIGTIDGRYTLNNEDYDFEIVSSKYQNISEEDLSKIDLLDLSVQPGLHNIRFRLDGLDGKDSSVEINNLSLKFYSPS